MAGLNERGDTIVNVVSVASDIAFPLQGMYCASKNAVQGFTDALRMELMQDGVPVAVTLVEPASIDSPIPERARNYMDRQQSLPPPLYRPELVANAILHARSIRNATSTSRVSFGRRPSRTPRSFAR